MKFRFLPPRILSMGICFSLTLAAWGQTQTVGTFLNTAESFDGYTLLAPLGSSQTHLIDNCGQVVNTWSSNYVSGGTCYLLADGSILRGCRVNGSFSGGGVGGRIEQRSWDDELVWTLDWADDEKHHHHDVEWLPNGHVLILAWELRTGSEASQAGRLNAQEMWPERITEIAPTFPEGGEVVWEWHAWDHLVQNVDSGLPNYGEPADFPHRIDVNYGAVGGGPGPGGLTSGDWTHANAVDFNPALDQIAISSRRFNEVWIINHATTTEEAAGPAGDLLYRYGNPAAYGRGDDSNQLFFGQHDVQWIPPGHPQEGQLMVYNNGDGRPNCDCSTVDIWQPPLLDDGFYAIEDGAPFGPTELSWTYPEALSTEFFSPNISGAQPLPNGNFLICEGSSGHLFEVTQTGETVWDYISPEGNFGVVNQGVNPQQNSVFRAYRFGPNFPGFEGRDMTPSAPLEGYEGDYEFMCDLYESPDTSNVSRVEPRTKTDKSLHLYPNPASDLLTLTSPTGGTWVILSLQGETVKAGSCPGPGAHVIDVSDLPVGMHWIQFMPINLDIPSFTTRAFIIH